MQSYIKYLTKHNSEFYITIPNKSVSERYSEINKILAATFLEDFPLARCLSPFY